MICAKTFAGLYARGSPCLLTGVGPKKMHNVLLGGQYATLPISTSLLPFRKLDRD